MRTESIETRCARVLNGAFRGGMRMVDLDSQPAPWVVRGLDRLEAGKSRRINAVTVRKGNDSQNTKLPR